MERIKLFEHEKKQIIYFDLSDIKTNAELSDVVENAKNAIKSFRHHSVYSITNINRIAFDTKTKEIAADWMAFNKPFVINAAFIGVIGMRKIMMTMVFALSNRTNVKLFNGMDQALDWIAALD